MPLREGVAAVHSTIAGADRALPEALELIAASRFDCVELDAEQLLAAMATIPRTRLIEDLSTSPLEFLSIGLVEHVTFGDLVQREHVLGLVHQFSEIAGAINAHYIVVTPGLLPEGVPGKEARHEMVFALRELGHIAKRYDVGIALRFSADPKASIRTIRRAMKAVYKADRVNVGLCLDTWDMALGGSSFEELHRIDPRSLFMMRLNDAEWPYDWGDESAAEMWLREHEALPQRLLPGAGNVAPGRVYQYMRHAGYRYYVSLTPEPATVSTTPSKAIHTAWSACSQELTRQHLPGESAVERGEG